MVTKVKMVTAGAMGAHLGITRQSATRLANEGVLKQAESGKFDLDLNRLAYLAHLRSRRSQKSEASDEFRRLRSREVSLRIGKLESSLMETAECLACVSELVGLVRTSFDGLPGRCTRDLAMRATIAGQVDLCLHLLADAAAKKAAGRRRMPSL
jgi:hypothetical protein